MEEVAPSDALRRAFHAAPARWDAFVAAYRLELDGNLALQELRRPIPSSA